MYRHACCVGRVLRITTTCLLLGIVPRALSFTPSTFTGPISTIIHQAHGSLSMSMSEQSNSGDDQSPPKNIVIAGAGIIGTSTAYYLAENFGIKVTLVDPTGQVAPAASGKAGGFLALDWNDMSPIQRLARRSFGLHQELADSLGAEKLQYRRLTCAAISVDPSKSKRPGGKKLSGVEWVSDGEGGDNVIGMRMIGTEETIAQVHPKKLCNALWNVASNAGCTLVQGRVVSPVHTDEGKLVGAKLADGTVLDTDALLFACGPRTTNAMTGVKYHSVIVPTSRVLSQSVFFDGCGDPEVYPRPDSTAYLCGFPDPAVVVQEQPGEEEVRPEAVKRILDAVKEASGGSQEGAALGSESVVESSCYLPTTADGLPIMGELPEESAGGAKCYVAAGHSCWGILLGPATGESMAHLIATGKSSEHVDLRPFNPSRFRGIRL